MLFILVYPSCLHNIPILHIYIPVVYNIQGPTQQVFSETGLFATICGRTDIFFFTFALDATQIHNIETCDFMLYFKHLHSIL